MMLFWTMYVEFSLEHVEKYELSIDVAVGFVRFGRECLCTGAIPVLSEGMYGQHHLG